jgi:subtilisin family serine protease
VVVFLERPLAPATVTRRLARVGLRRVTDDSSETEVNDSPWHYWIANADGGEVSSQQLTELGTAMSGAVAGISPAYRRTGRTGGDPVCPRADRLLVRLQEGLAEELRLTAGGLLADVGLVEVTACAPYLCGYRYFHTSPGGPSAYAALDSLGRHPELFRSVRLENVPYRVPWTRQPPTDPLLPLQWALERVGADEAWASTSGSSDVTILVLDSGSQLDHPDLSFADDGINVGLALLGTEAPGGPLTGNEHGTMMAGVVAATWDNQTGIAGLAPDCRVVPAAFLSVSDAEVVFGLGYASAIGAQVVNMSFGVRITDPDWNFDVVGEAIEAAQANDVLMCASVGNFAEATVLFPAAHPLVVGVGGTASDDERWFEPERMVGMLAAPRGSHAGEGVAVAAPATAILTTDLTGEEGRTSGDYMVSTGTSPACAHVSGLAGLVRSANPFLTNEDTRTVLELTAAKVGVTPYNETPGFPNGTRNDFLGHGRIDAAAAVEESVGLFLQQLNHLILDQP